MRTMPLAESMTRMRRRALALAAIVALALAACSTDTDRANACYPGDKRDCACPGGLVGWQKCGSDGRGYAADDGSGAACDCSGSRPPIVELNCDPLPSGKVPFMCGCATNDDCETGLCNSFPAKGSKCSMTCSVPADCPAPSGDCNQKGVCKAP
jgi:hypothetical protein